MRTIGVSGSLDTVAQRREYLFPTGWSHDAAAVLVEDGEVTFAVEEERFNRIKHTSKAPIAAIRACLESRRLALSDIDYFAIYGSEFTYDGVIRGVRYSNPDVSCTETMRQLAHRLLIEQLEEDIDDQKLVFVPHHLAHAVGAYVHSGYANSLVVTFDGAGDGLSGLVAHATPAGMTVMRTAPLGKSLGFFYNTLIRAIGFGNFEEYKAMGLAPYGNPQTLRGAFARLYELQPEGEFVIHWERFPELHSQVEVRRRGEPFSERHRDFAAALQESLEHIALHVVRHFKRTTGATRLCLAGGVAHNCSMNGKLLYSDMFDEIFVHPAAHDAGCAVGAALYPQLFMKGFRARESTEAVALTERAEVTETSPDTEHSGTAPAPPLCSVYWGEDVEEKTSFMEQVARWQAFVDCRVAEDVAVETARLIADGSIIGWMQGRSEFGPRALGNRSILADPRPARNKDVVNAMVKKREAFRPFAPAVLEEYVAEYFELPRARANLSFMTFVLRVRPEKRSLLGATTHVDGTARPQTVSRRTNPRFWELIEAFRLASGIPVLLNTSFNNNAEPIVDSVHDGLTCFLTTGLDYLIIGDHIIAKKAGSNGAFLTLRPRLPEHVILRQEQRGGPRPIRSYLLANTYDEHTTTVSEVLWNVLRDVDGSRTLRELLPVASDEPDGSPIHEELHALWGSRQIILEP
jgi:carbamoyltransferase